MSTHLLPILAAALVLLAPLPLARRLATRRQATPDPVAEALATGLLWCSLLTLEVMALGGLHLLHAWPLVILSLTLLTAGIRPGAPALEIAPAGWTSWLLWIPLAGAAALAAGLAFGTLKDPITNFDSVFYHLPQMAEWAQTGALGWRDLPLPTSRYPFAWEALCTAPVVMLHGDLLALLPNLVSWLIFGLAIVHCARLLGADTRTASLCALIALVAPETLEGLLAAHVDLPLAAMVIATLAFLLEARRTGSRHALAMALIATGWVLGIKLSGVLYLGLIAVACLPGYLAVERRPVAEDSPRWLLFGAVLIAGCIGISWYLRNLIGMGNPFGYIDTTIGGVTLFKAPESLNSIVVDAADVVTRAPIPRDPLVAGVRRAFGLAPILLAASMLVGLVVPRAGSIRRAWARRITLIGLVAGIAVIYMLHREGLDPQAGSTRVLRWTLASLRYLLPGLGILAIGGAIGLSIHRAGRWVAAVGAVIALIHAHQVLGGGIDRTAAFLAVLLVAAWAWPRARMLRPVLAFLVMFACTGLASRAWTVREEARPTAYGDWYTDFLERVEPGSTVGFTTSTQSFLLYGPRLTNSVHWVGWQPAKREERNNPRLWLQSVDLTHLDYIVSGPYSGRLKQWKTRPELRWLLQFRDHFEIASTSSNRLKPMIFRVIHEPMSGDGAATGPSS